LFGLLWGDVKTSLADRCKDEVISGFATMTLGSYDENLGTVAPSIHKTGDKRSLGLYDTGI